MLGYRLYFTDIAGHILHALEFECEGDEEAIALAEKRGTRPMELWQRNRLVQKFAASPETSMAPASRSGPYAEGPEPAAQGD